MASNNGSLFNDSGQFSNGSSYSSQIAQYRQSGDLCAYLGIEKHSKQDDNHLGDKLDALEAVGIDLASFQAAGLWGLLFPTVVRQLRIAECSFVHYLAMIQTISYYNSTLIYYSRYGFVSPIWPWIVLPGIVAILSLLFNLSLIIVTIRKVSLSKLCNWLIAFDSFAQIPAVLPLLVNLFAAIFSLDTVEYRVCLATLMLSTGGCYASFLAVFLISLERLLIVTFPFRMNRVSMSTIKLCSVLAFAVCFLFGCIMVLAQFRLWTIINLAYDRWLYCNSGLYSDVLNTPISYVLLSLSICNYAIIGGFMVWNGRSLTRTTPIQQQPAVRTIKIEENVALLVTRRMLRSVLTISTVLLIGWVIGSSARNQITTLTRNAVNAIVNSLVSDQNAASRISNNASSWLIGLITCLFVIASGINAPVLIISNSEYRKAYKRTFIYIFTGRKSSVGPLFTVLKPVPTRAAAATASMIRRKQNEQK